MSAGAGDDDRATGAARGREVPAPLSGRNAYRVNGMLVAVAEARQVSPSPRWARLHLNQDGRK